MILLFPMRSQLKMIKQEMLEGREKHPIILVPVSRVGSVPAESHDMQMSLRLKLKFFFFFFSLNHTALVFEYF